MDDRWDPTCGPASELFLSREGCSNPSPRDGYVDVDNEGDQVSNNEICSALRSTEARIHRARKKLNAETRTHDLALKVSTQESLAHTDQPNPTQPNHNPKPLTEQPFGAVLAVHDAALKIHTTVPARMFVRNRGSEF